MVDKATLNVAATKHDAGLVEIDVNMDGDPKVMMNAIEVVVKNIVKESVFEDKQEEFLDDFHKNILERLKEEK